MRLLSALIVFCLLLGFSDFSSAEEKCGSDTIEEVTFGWCITQENRGGSRDILYYLHGGGGDEYSWSEHPDHQLIQEYWEERGIPAPTVVTVSFGQAWLLTNENHGQKKSLLPLFISGIIPHLEARLGAFSGRRLLMGESMGGFNSIQALFAAPGLFSRVALVCPGIPTIGPYSSKADVDSYIQRHQPYVRRDFVDGLIRLSRFAFSTPESWDMHDPIKLVSRADPSRTLPPLHVISGEWDEFGFHEGTTKFVELAWQKGVSAEWVSIPSGGHCIHTEISIERLARFLGNN